MAKKIQLGYKDIETRLLKLKDNPISARQVGYEILIAFGKSEKDISRYKEGKGILKTFDGLLIKNEFCYRPSTSSRLTYDLESLKHDNQVLKATPKIVCVSDGATVLAYDLREKDTYENPIDRMYCDFTFFYPLMNVERVHYVEENPADIKAAEKLAKLHDELRAYNEFDSDDDLHDLNIFISRLLFCFFAEDTGIFESNLFTSSIERFTKPDGSDLSEYLEKAFGIMDTMKRSEDTPSIIRQFPYVNGGLFRNHIRVPKMGRKARRIILECGELDWKDINPDIFGSMIQAVVNPDIRAKEGMHYTSVPNIMKVINPLFMDELRGEYNRLSEQFHKEKEQLDLNAINLNEFYKRCKTIVKGCKALLLRMSKMKFFDPACGSGNFLIITYKTLRLLEMDIIRLQRQCTREKEIDFIDGSCITLNQFYGIELIDFAHEIAMLSLWLAQHQMDNKFHDSFGVNTRALPLHNINQIICGNACRLDWDKVCPHAKDDEVYVFGNPPYLGSKLQDENQKADVELVFHNLKGSTILDYISNWFYKGAKYVSKTKARCAFVSTNSISQGEQVGVLWPAVYKLNVDIQFAYTSFKWNNNAKNIAAVICVIIGLCDKSYIKKCLLFNDNQKKEVKSISAYLTANSRTIVTKQTTDPKGLPKLCFGCMPYDDRKNKFLRLDSEQVKELVEEFPKAQSLIRKMYGSEEFINGKEQYCLWIDDDKLPLAKSILPIKERIDANRNFRLNESKDGQELANRPHQFREHPHDAVKIIIPRVSSEKRHYIPIGYLSEDAIVSDSAFALYNAPLWLFGILTSEIHMAWVRAVGGKLKTDYRYSAGLCYNPYPFPYLTSQQKEEIEEKVSDVLIARASHPEMTLAELYNPEKMPKDLLEAHQKLDKLVDSFYPGSPFYNDEERMECLFGLYEKRIKKVSK